jgi:P4 family phage/plasmid primase-like protien
MLNNNLIAKKKLNNFNNNNKNIMNNKVKHNGMLVKTPTLFPEQKWNGFHYSSKDCSGKNGAKVYKLIKGDILEYFILNGIDNNIYELIPSNLSVKLFFDIDCYDMNWKYKNSNDCLEELNNLLTKYCSNNIKLYEEYLPIDIKYIQLADSSREKKISFRIIYNNFCFENIASLKIFIKRLIKFIKVENPIFIGKDVIDIKCYGLNQNIRCFNQSKKGSNSILKPITKINNYLDTLCGWYEKPPHNLISLSASVNNEDQKIDEAEEDINNLQPIEYLNIYSLDCIEIIKEMILKIESPGNYYKWSGYKEMIKALDQGTNILYETFVKFCKNCEDKNKKYDEVKNKYYWDNTHILRTRKEFIKNRDILFALCKDDKLIHRYLDISLTKEIKYIDWNHYVDLGEYIYEKYLKNKLFALEEGTGWYSYYDEKKYIWVDCQLETYTRPLLRLVEPIGKDWIKWSSLNIEKDIDSLNEELEVLEKELEVLEEKKITAKIRREKKKLKKNINKLDSKISKLEKKLEKGWTGLEMELKGKKPIFYKNLLSYGIASLCRIDTASNWDKYFNTQKDHLPTISGQKVCLKTGEITKLKSTDYFTFVCETNYNPKAKCPNTLKFLGEVFDVKNEPKKLEFIQMYLGYCITGRTHLQKVLFLEGKGSNGKSVLVKLLQNVFGSKIVYILPQSALKKSSGNNDFLYYARNARIMIVNESDNELNFNLFKQLSGDDYIKVMAKYKAPIGYYPPYCILYMTNNPPTLPPNADICIVRRIYELFMKFVYLDKENDITDMLFYDKSNPNHKQRDFNLSEKLDNKEEKEGFLAWLIEGSKKFYKFNKTIPTQFMPMSVIKLTKTLINKAKAVIYYCKKAIIEKEGNNISLKKLHTHFCRDMGYNPNDFTQNKFSSQLNQNPRYTGKIKNVRLSNQYGDSYVAPGLYGFDFRLDENSDIVQNEIKDDIMNNNNNSGLIPKKPFISKFKEIVDGVEIDVWACRICKKKYTSSSNVLSKYKYQNYGNGECVSCEFG